MKIPPSTPRLKFCLLGGSNSLRRNGIRRGLGIHVDVLNYALGASTSLQNVFALTRNARQIAGVDAIVTESNVNDVYAVFNANAPVSVVKNNIQKLYRELALTGKPIVSIILPTRNYKAYLPPGDLVSEISRHHLEMAQNYGVSIIDVEEALKTYDSNHLEVRKIIPDALHPVDSFMHALGQNIGLYAADICQPVSVTGHATNFEILEATTFCGPGRNKKNSYFNETVVDLTQPSEVRVTDGRCVAFSTWSDAPSEIVIETDATRIVRQFNDKLAFHDLNDPLQGKICFRSNIGHSVGISEKSMNVTPIADLHHPVSMVALMIEKAECIEPPSTGAGKNLAHLIPSSAVHIDSAEEVLRSHRSLLSTLTPEEIDLVYRAAVKLEAADPATALKLMLLAQKHRPNGPRINRRIDRYQKNHAQGNPAKRLNMLRRIMTAIKK